jgi:hypothetical protein
MAVEGSLRLLWLDWSTSIGLLLGTEEDWPTAFETLISRLGPITDASAARHRVTPERITIEPFPLSYKPRHDLVVDRLALPRAGRHLLEVDRYRDFCDSRLSHVGKLVLDWIVSAEFDRLLVHSVRSNYPAHEHERFIGHFRGLIGQWVRERGATATLSR